jgi:hypothetical protein
VGVPRRDLLEHRRECLIEVYLEGVRQTDDDEEDIRQLHRDRTLGLARLLGFLAEAVVDLACQLAGLFCETGDVGER